MRNGTERSAARDALQNVSDFVRYLLIIIIILFSYNYVINIQIDILRLNEYFWQWKGVEYSQIRRQNTGSMGCIPPQPKGGEIFLFYTDDPKKTRYSKYMY